VWDLVLEQAVIAALRYEERRAAASIAAVAAKTAAVAAAAAAAAAADEEASGNASDADEEEYSSVFSFMDRAGCSTAAGTRVMLAAQSREHSKMVTLRASLF
jgi:hypothetical protein